jgi:hypothetical protein
MRNRIIFLGTFCLCMFWWVEALSKPAPPSSAIIGSWEGHKWDMELVAGTSYSFIFSSDSFWLTEYFINDVPVPCVNSRGWHEYSKGTLNQRNDTLLLEGYYTDSLFLINSVEHNSKNCGSGRAGAFAWRPRFVVSQDSLHFKDPFNEIKFTRSIVGTLRSKAPTPPERMVAVKKGSRLAIGIKSTDMLPSIEIFGINGAQLAKTTTLPGSLKGGMAVIGLPKTGNVFVVRVTTPQGRRFTKVSGY